MLIQSKLLKIFAVVTAVLFQLFCDNPFSSDEQESGKENGLGLVADQYEPDNLRFNAKNIGTDSVIQNRTIIKGDSDWVYFQGTAGNRYVITAAGKTAKLFLQINLFSDSGTTLLAFGANSLDSTVAMVIYTCLSSGKYRFCVHGINNDTGSYLLSVNTEKFITNSIDSILNYSGNASLLRDKIEPGKTDSIKFHISTTDSVILKAIGTGALSFKLYSKDKINLIATSIVVDTIAQIKSFLSAGDYYLILFSQDTSVISYLMLLKTQLKTLIFPYSHHTDSVVILKEFSDSVIIRGTLQINDTDWVKVPLQEGRRYKIVDSTISTPNAFLVSVFSIRGTLLGHASSVFQYECMNNGPIFLKITPAINSPVNYSITIKDPSQLLIADKYEPDNTKDLAKQKYFASDSLFQERSLNVTNFLPDTDWVAFPVYEEKKYTIEAKSPGDNAILRLYSKTNSVLNTGMLSNRIVYTPTFTDTVYLLVITNSIESVSYSLSIYGTPANDSFENDSARSISKSIVYGVQNRILIPGDTDWVYYNLEAGDSIEILTTGSTDTKLALFSGNGIVPLAENDDISASNTNSVIKFRSATGGKFYIRVTGKTTTTTGKYDLAVLSEKIYTLVSEDTFEIDNSRATATFITDTAFTGQSHTLTLNDTDWIAIPVLSGYSYTLSISNHPANEVNLIGYRSDATLISSRLNISSPLIRFSPEKNDTCYFLVTSDFTVAQYSISLSCIAIPLPDDYENDNTKSQATIITDTVLNAQGHTLLPSDTDWVAFPVIAGVSYKFTISSISGNVFTRYYSDNSFIEEQNGSTLSFSFTATANNIIYLQIFSAMPIQNYKIFMSRAAQLSPDSK